MSDPPRPVGPYSPAVRCGEWLVCSGQLGLVDGRLVEGVAAQTAQSLANVAALLEAFGASLNDVAKTTVFLADIASYDEMNAAYSEAFGGHRPARSAFAVASLPLGAAVEIEAWAWREGGF